MSKKDEESTVSLVYDAQCPVCKPLVDAIQIKDSAGKLEIINARNSCQIMDEVNNAGFDIDNAMVLKYQGKLLYGADAYHQLALLGSNHNLINKLNSSIFKYKILVISILPFLKLIRFLAYKFKNIPKINNLQKD